MIGAGRDQCQYTPNVNAKNVHNNIGCKAQRQDTDDCGGRPLTSVRRTSLLQFVPVQYRGGSFAGLPAYICRNTREKHMSAQVAKNEHQHGESIIRSQNLVQ